MMAANEAEDTKGAYVVRTNQVLWVRISFPGEETFKLRSK